MPEIAARAHAELIDPVVRQALLESGHELAEMDAIAATSGPGLIGGLIVGVMTAKAMAAASGKPFLGVNHLEGHALTAGLTDNVQFPYLLLLVSGGHTQVLLVRGVGDSRGAGRRRSTTRLARPSTRRRNCSACHGRAGRKWSGGPNWAIRNGLAFPARCAAKSGWISRFRASRPLSGMATQTINFESEQDIADICASFQEAVADTLQERLAWSLDPVQIGISGHRRTGAGGKRRRGGEPAAARAADQVFAPRTATASSHRRWRCAPTMRR